MLGVHSDTVQAVCKRSLSAAATRTGKRPRWRGKKSLRLGAVFAAARAITMDGDAVVVYLKRRYRFWNSRAIDGDVIPCWQLLPGRARALVSSICKSR